MARVLLIDASATVRRFVRGALEERTHQIATADSLRSGLDAAQSFVPDVILVDPIVGDLDFGAFMGALRGTSNIRHAEVLLISALPPASRGDLESLVNDSISKPFRPHALAAAVSQALQRKTAPEPVAFPSRPPAPTGAFEVRQALNTLPPNWREWSDDRLLKWAKALASKISSGEAALQGDLEHMALPEVLQILEHRQLDGALFVSAPDGRSIGIFVRGGKLALALAEGFSTSYLLGRYLIQDGLVERTEVERLSRRTASGARLGERLVRMGYADREDIERSLASQSKELVYEVLRWPQGRFEFRANSPALHDLGADLQLSMTGILMEGLRRVDEWRMVEKHIPSFSLVPQIDPLLVDPSRASADAFERRILELVDGARTVQEVIDASQSGPFEVCKALYSLAATNAIRFARILR